MQTRRMHKYIELSIHIAYKEQSVEITNGETIPTKSEEDTSKKDKKKYTHTHTE